MTLILTVLMVLLLSQLIFVVWNLSQFPGLDGQEGGPFPTVSVLIPARNEARRIGECLESLASQTVQPMEVLILDDQSTDETAEVVKSYIARFDWIHLIEGNPLPDGWSGKSFACHQLANEARGEWLLFLDADVRLEGAALHQALQCASEQKTGLITGFPRQLVQTWLEKLVVPLMLFTIACHLPIRLVRSSQDPKFVAAHGGFIMIESECYQNIGGHETNRGHLVDDMELARTVKKNGFPVRLTKIDRFVWMRMYENASEVWKGYQKNLFPGVNRNLGLLSMVLCVYFFLYVFPIGVFLGGLVMGQVNWMALADYGLGVLLKSFIDVKNGLSGKYGLFLPISIVIMTCLAISSAWHSTSGRGYSWKGRRYQ